MNMKIIRLIFFFFTELNCVVGFSQDWIKSFTDGNSAHPRWVIETYDKGYLLLDNEDVYSWIIKTDINGNKLWEKRIGTGQNHIYLWNIEQTLDGGYILAGAFAKYGGQNDDPVLIKLNSCGELDWCSIIKTVGIDDFGTRGKQTLEEDYILLAQGSVFIPGENVQLFKFDHSGNLIWKHTYSPDTLIWSPEPNDIRVDNDGYLISATCYYPDLENPAVGYERPYYIKTDTAGNLLWWLVYGSVNGLHGFIGDATIKSSTGNFYSIGIHSNYCDTPVLVKCTANGQESYFQDLMPGVCPGGVSCVNFLNDSTFVIFAGGNLNNEFILRWLKTDTMGVTNYYRQYTESWMTSTQHTVKTFDNKFVSISKESSIWIYLYKLNSDLEFDSIYTQQFTYDSLCPGGVISDTINPDCDLIVSTDDSNVESELSKLQVYPNPASGNLTIGLPEYLKIIDKKAGMTTSTVYYQWQYTKLEIYDLFGKLMFSKKIPKQVKSLDLNVSEWNEGLYIARLEFNNESLCLVKFIISR
jgi:hypothetical protein